MNKQINKIKRKVEKMLRSHSDVYSLGSWVGNELKVTLQNLDPAYVNFRINEDNTKYKITVCLGSLPEINETVYPA